MGDHLVLLVGRLLTESNLEAAIESEIQLEEPVPSTSDNIMVSSFCVDVDSRLSSSKFHECRICHDEDEELNMEAPCSCSGSLKYAHRDCVQRWCNEKGNTSCEICQQEFKPGYTAPPPLFYCGGIPMNFRRDLHNPQYTSMVTTDHEYHPETDFDEYSAPSSGSLICCRIVAIIFMVLLVLRHILPILVSGDGDGDYSLLIFMLLTLRTVGILLPIYIMVRAFTAMQRGRHHPRDPEISPETSDEENELPRPLTRLILVQ